MPSLSRRLLFALSALGLMLSSAAEALADKRVALVIGNSAYRHAARLPNPVKDAAAVETLLKDAGFEVVARRDLGGLEMRRVIRDFADLAQDADIALVFYAGHGIEVDGTNYLLPVDTVLERDSDVEDEAVSLDRVLRVIDPARRLRLVILDACRDNPFAKTMKRSIATRSATRGLAKVEPTNTDTLIAFAAKAGSTAIDGDGANSPFTTALLQHILVPGLDLRIAFGRVRDAVLKSTKRRQEPFVYGSLGGDVVSLVAAPAATATAAPAPAAPVTVATATAAIAPADAPRRSLGFEQYQGHSFEVEFTEAQINIPAGSGVWRVRKSIELYVKSPDALITSVSHGVNKTMARHAITPLDMTDRGVVWNFRDAKLAGGLRGPGFFMRPVITLSGQSCEATVSYDRFPGKSDFEVIRASDNKHILVSALAAENVTCRVVKGDVVSQKTQKK